MDYLDMETKEAYECRNILGKWLLLLTVGLFTFVEYLLFTSSFSLPTRIVSKADDQGSGYQGAA